MHHNLCHYKTKRQQAKAISKPSITYGICISPKKQHNTPEVQDELFLSQVSCSHRFLFCSLYLCIVSQIWILLLEKYGPPTEGKIQCSHLTVVASI